MSSESNSIRSLRYAKRSFNGSSTIYGEMKRTSYESQMCRYCWGIVLERLGNGYCEKSFVLLYAASREPRRGETPVTRASAVPAAALAWGSSVEYRQLRKSKKAAPQGAVPPRYGAASSALRQKYGDRPPPLSLFHHPFSSFFQSSERPAFTPPYPPDDPHICAARYDSKNRRALP